MVVPGYDIARQEKIIGIHFGTQVFKGQNFAEEDKPEVVKDYNRVNDLLTITASGEIESTEYGRQLQFTSGNWRNRGLAYLAAIERPPLDFDRLLETLATNYGIADNRAA